MWKGLMGSLAPCGGGGIAGMVVGHKIRRTPYPAPEEQADETERHIQECIDAGLVLEYKDGDYS